MAFALRSGAGRGLATWLAVLLVAWAVWVAWPRCMVKVRSEVTGKTYVVKNLPDAQAVADRLATLEVRLNEFLAKAEAYAPGDPRLANIRRRWSGTLSEIVYDPEVAYSLGKDTVSLCVRNKGTGGLEPENTSMFVLLHELAHVATDEYGHTDRFWANMQLLLEIAEAVGMYRYEDFEAEGTEYCGRRLLKSPLTCVKNKGCASALAGLKN